jgi:hypothetical protein
MLRRLVRPMAVEQLYRPRPGTVVFADDMTDALVKLANRQARSVDSAVARS